MSTEPTVGNPTCWHRLLSGRMLGFVAQVVVSVLMLRMVLLDVKVSESVASLMALPASFLFFAVGGLVAVQPLIVLRWWSVLCAMGCGQSFWSLLRITLVGLLFNNVVPGLMGQDAARVFYAGRQSGYIDAGASVLFDKVLGLLAMLLFGSMFAALHAGGGSGLLGVVPQPALAVPVLVNASTICSVAVAVLFLGMLALLVPFERLLHPERVANPWLSKLLAGLVGLVVGLRSGVRLEVLGVGILSSALVYLVLAGIYQDYFVLMGFAVPGFGVLFVVVSMTTAVTNLPVSFNGIGIREQVNVILLVALGMSKEAAVGLAIVQYVALLVLSLIGLVVFLTMRSQRPAAS